MEKLENLRQGAKEKLQPLHYEVFCDYVKKATGSSPLFLIEQAVRLLGLNEKEVITHLNDTPYQVVALEIMKAMIRAYHPSVAHLADDLTIESLYSESENSMFLGEFRSLMNMLHHIHRFSKQRMVFRFEEALTAKLLHTDLTKVDSFFVRSPFSSIYIAIPHNKELFIPNEVTGLHRVLGIYVSYLDEIPSEEMHLGSGGTASELENVKENTPIKVLRILAIAEKNENALHDKDDATFYMTMIFRSGDVMPQVEVLLDKFVSKETIKHRSLLKKLFVFVTNALLYITSPAADLVLIGAKFDKEKPGKGPSRAPKNSKIDVISTGSKVYISHEYRMKYRNGQMDSLPAVDVTINTPMWIVRGHYRNQAHGKGRSLRTLIWIQPHIKGKGLDDTLQQREYTVN